MIIRLACLSKPVPPEGRKLTMKEYAYCFKALSRGAMYWSWLHRHEGNEWEARLYRDDKRLNVILTR